MMRRMLRTVFVTGMALAASAGSAATAWAQDGSQIGLVEITGSPEERPHPLAWLMGQGENPTLRTLVESIGRAGDDATLSGLVIRLKDATLSMTQVEELGAAIRKARAGGKKVHIFTEAAGPGELALGSFADEMMVQAGGGVSFPGLHMEEMFLADTLGWAGLRAELVQVGAYKGANEQFTRSEPSPQWNQNIEQLLDSLYANLRSPILKGRKMSDAALDAAMNDAWMADAGDAVTLGLLDAEVDLAGLTAHLAKAHPGKVIWRKDVIKADGGEFKPDMTNPFAMMAVLSKEPPKKATRPSLAVLHINGAIVDGESQEGGLLGGSSVGSRTIRNAIEDIMGDEQIRGVVVRIDSPGGSAIASEVIWQGLERLKAKKPVWVSVGSMAASGGYYIAVGGDKIYVNPSSIVGSIGVVGGKISMDGLYEKLKVKVVSRDRGPRAGLFRSTGAWSPEEEALVRGKMTSTYELFTSRVAQGRKGIDLSKTAEGRLFTGDKAITLEMADAVGGLENAMGDLAREVGLSSYDVLDYPGPKSIGEMIEDMLGQFVIAPGVDSSTGVTPLSHAARELLGEQTWSQIQRSWSGFLELREQRVILMSPRVLIVK